MRSESKKNIELQARLQSTYKFCKLCHTRIVLKIERDIHRKNFCSRHCNGLYSYECRKNIVGFYDKIIQAMNTPSANCKKNFPGENSPKWIKDRTKLKNKRCFFEEREFFKEVIRERNYTCELTGKVGGKLSVHHKNGVKKFPHLRYDKKNVVVILKSIHKKFHKLYGTIDVTENKWNDFIKNKEYAST